MKWKEGKDVLKEQERDKLTLRISKQLNARTKEKASYLGVSQNNLLLVLMDLGLKCYEVNPRLVEDELSR